MFKNNDNVNITGTKIYGKIKSISNKNAMLKTSDFKTIIVPIDKLEKSNNVENNNVEININYNLQPNNNDTKNEVMLRHLTKEEALEKLDLFISRCLVNKEYKIKIIHGKNGGILRKAVHEYLNNSPYIEKYELAGYFEGQYGTTIAYLKNKNT